MTNWFLFMNWLDIDCLFSNWFHSINQISINWILIDLELQDPGDQQVPHDCGRPPGDALPLEVQGDQLYMAVFFWYLVKIDLSIVRVYSSVRWTSHFLQGKKKNTAMQFIRSFCYFLIFFFWIPGCGKKANEILFYCFVRRIKPNRS